MKRRKSVDVRLPLLVGWWLLWLVISQTSWNVVVAPSAMALAHFGVLLAAFAGGAAFIQFAHRASASIGKSRRLVLDVGSLRVRMLAYGLGLAAMLVLLVGLQMAGAFSTSFLEYFAKLRMSGMEEGSLTGLRLLDSLTKVFAFPVSYGLLLVALAIDVRRTRALLAICLCNFALFSYLWQVNYSLIHLFWLTFFYLVSRHADGLRIPRGLLFGLAIACALLIASALNRFGDDDDALSGALHHYVMGYHLIGFSFYDFHLADPGSLLHDHSYGRSSLGFLEQLPEHVARVIGGEFVAASSQNAAFNDAAVSIGTGLALDFNAFGTLAFSFYRDFGIFGIAIGGFLYGAAITYAMLNMRRHWMAAAAFYLLASAWMVGMMVSSIEQAYFWFCLLFLAATGSASLRWTRLRASPRRRVATRTFYAAPGQVIRTP